MRHYRLTCWPRHGLPSDPHTLTSFLREVKMVDSRGPVVVHCSAGIGRTAILLALDIGLQGILQVLCISDSVHTQPQPHPLTHSCLLDLYHTQ